MPYLLQPGSGKSLITVNPQATKCLHSRMITLMHGSVELMRLSQSKSSAQPLCLRQVIGVIRRKCMFKNRPRAIITKPEPPVRRQQ